jgi:hypothetical protein
VVKVLILYRKFLSEKLNGLETWVIGGALCGWGDFIIPQLQCVIYLSVPIPVCLQRMLKRDFEYFGNRILAGGDLHQVHSSFLHNTTNYEYNEANIRGKKRHEL